MNATELQQLVVDARDLVTARRVYGEPYEKNGLTVIPAASVRGGGGGGSGQHGDEEAGGGGGFGLAARPVGAWIVDGDNAMWKPAVDVNRIVLGGQIVALAAILVAGRLLAVHRGSEFGSHPRPRRRFGPSSKRMGRR
jgi:uncharacterized spore protein YtfJ